MHKAAKRFPYLSKKYIALILAVIFILLAFVLPWLWPDSSATYIGVKKDAANEGINFIAQMSSGINYASHFGTIRLTTESVVETEDAKANNQRCNSDFKSSSDPNASNYYTVTVGYRTLFGLLMGTEQVRVCRYL